MGTINISHPSVRRGWSMDINRTKSQQSYLELNGLFKPGDTNSIITGMKMKVSIDGDEGFKTGYRCDFDLDGPLDGYATPGDQNITQDRSTLSLFNDTIEVNQARKSAKDQGTFAEGLVPYSFMERVRNRMGQYWAEWEDQHMIVKLCGAIGDGTWTRFDAALAATSARDIKGSVAFDGNDLRAPSTNRIIYGDGTVTTAATVTTNMGLNLDGIDACVLLAVRPQANATLQRTVEPIIEQGRPTFVYLADMLSLVNMARDTSGRWYNLQRAFAEGGYKTSALLNGAAGIYKSVAGYDVIIKPHPRMVYFSAATTGGEKQVRNLLLGRSAGRIAHGVEQKSDPALNMYVGSENDGNTKFVTTGYVVGFQKTAYRTTETGNTREDYGTIAHDVYCNWS